jgi:hypothetical protein
MSFSDNKKDKIYVVENMGNSTGLLLDSEEVKTFYEALKKMFRLDFIDGDLHTGEKIEEAEENENYNPNNITICYDFIHNSNKIKGSNNGISFRIRKEIQQRTKHKYYTWTIFKIGTNQFIKIGERIYGSLKSFHRILKDIMTWSFIPLNCKISTKKHV